MKILIVLTYYRPHISGLTIYAERLARAFAARGHQVTVLTSRFDHSLPAEEVLHGVRIVRAPVLFRLSKGVIMPTFGYLASKLVREHDVVQLHLPQFDAAGVALRGRLLGKPTVVTYHCDLELPPGLLNRIANQVVLLMNNLAALFTHRIVTYTEDYAAHSAYTRRFTKKVAIIPPPVVLPEISAEERLAFAREHNPQQCHPVIGMLARFATEKGVEVLLKAIPSILDRYPQALFEFVGPYQNIIGEEAYFERLKPLLDQYQASGHWKFIGPLPPEKVAAFFANLDLLCVPSLNSTESFGLVQIEAMMNGVRCITSDLPGVRQPVLMHHMGRIIPIGDSAALAKSVAELLDDPAEKPENSEEFLRYDPDQTAGRYEDLFAEIMSELKKQ